MALIIPQNALLSIGFHNILKKYYVNSSALPESLGYWKNPLVGGSISAAVKEACSAGAEVPYFSIFFPCKGCLFMLLFCIM